MFAIPTSLSSGKYAGVPIDELPNNYLIGVVCWWYPKDGPLYDVLREEAEDRVNEGMITEPAASWISGKDSPLELNDKQTKALTKLLDGPKFPCGAQEGITYKSLRNRGLALSNKLGQTEITTRGKEWLNEHFGNGNS